MQFIYPQILWALLALTIPIIIHLFHFRRFKKVYFTNVKFLKEIKEEKSTRNKLRNLLVLITRLLAFSFIIFAFAQPFISKNETSKTGKNYISIFIDNSNSMMALSEDVPLLEKAKSKAEEIIEAYSDQDEFQILSHELKGSQQRWLTKENVIQAIEDIELNPEVSPLSLVLNKQKQSAPADGNHIIYLLSDFQKSITDFPIMTDTLREINLLSFHAIKESNIAIDSAWFESMVPALNQSNKLYVRIKNFSDEKKDDVRLSITHNGQNRPEGTFDLQANSSKIDTINLLFNQSGWQQLSINIDDYPIQFDDRYFLSFNIKDEIEVLSINNNGSSKFLNALFQGLGQFNLNNVNVSNIQYDQLKEYDLIILRDLEDISSGLSSELKNYLSLGGNVLVFPNQKINQENYNQFLKSIEANSISAWSDDEKSVFKINTSEFVFENVFEDNKSNLKLPTTSGQYTTSKFSNSTAEYLLQYRDGSDYLMKYKYNKGHLYFCVSPLDLKFNDLVTNAEIFVPLLYKLGFSSMQNDKTSYVIGKDNVMTINNASSNGELIYKITGKSEFIPGQVNLGPSTQVNFNNMIKEDGYFQLQINDQLIKQLAFNFDRVESNLDYFGNNELKEKYSLQFNILDNVMGASLTNIIKEKDQGITFWRWCLILALLFLAIETLLLRLWKV